MEPLSPKSNQVVVDGELIDEIKRFCQVATQKLAAREKEEPGSEEMMKCCPAASSAVPPPLPYSHTQTPNVAAWLSGISACVLLFFAVAQEHAARAVDLG